MIRSKLKIIEVWNESFLLFKNTFSHVWLLAAAIGAIMSIPFVLNTLYPIKQNTINTINIICFVASIIALLIKFYLTSLVLTKTAAIGEGRNETLSSLNILVEKHYLNIALGMLIIYTSCMIGFLLLIVPMVIISILLSMTQALILLDNKNFFSALKESIKLVWGNWWHTFFSFSIIICASLLLAVVLFFILYIEKFFHMHISSSPNPWYGIIGNAIGMIFTNIIVCPLYYSIVFVQFNNLKARQKISSN